jgi:hypothetical protein
VAAADCGNVEVYCEFLKHIIRVVIAIKTYSELLTAAAVKDHVDVFRDLLKTGACMKVPKKCGSAPFITAARTGICRY